MRETHLYYRSETGVTGVNTNNVKHQSGDYTFLAGRTPAYTWIKTCDLFETKEEAENSLTAKFL